MKRLLAFLKATLLGGVIVVLPAWRRTKVLHCRSTKFVLSSWATVEKKNYEVTKPQTTSLRDRHRWSRIPLVGLQRIRAASRIAGHEHNNVGRGTGSQIT